MHIQNDQDLDNTYNIDKVDVPEAIRHSGPWSWSYFPVDIYLSQPGQRKAWVCPDFMTFCARAAQKFDLRIVLLGVDRTTSWELASWP